MNGGIIQVDGYVVCLKWSMGIVPVKLKRVMSFRMCLEQFFEPCMMAVDHSWWRDVLRLCRLNSRIMSASGMCMG